MNFGGCFDAIAARYGENIAVARAGQVLATGRALLQPMEDNARQNTPTPLGGGREERLLCLGERSLPLDTGAGALVILWGEERYDVVNAQAFYVAGEPVYWRAVLRREDAV